MIKGSRCVATAWKTCRASRVDRMRTFCNVGCCILGTTAQQCRIVVWRSRREIVEVKTSVEPEGRL